MEPELFGGDKGRRLILLAVSLFLIGSGVYLTYEWYQSQIYSFDLSIQMLQQIKDTSEPQSIADNAYTIKDVLPKFKNPVLRFPTHTIDFDRIQSDLDNIIQTTEKIEKIPEYSSGFKTGILDVYYRSDMIDENLQKTRPYLFASVANLLYNLVWLLGAVGVNRALRKTTT